MKQPVRRLSWSDAKDLILRLAGEIAEKPRYDAILAITRGGMVPACLISEFLDLRNVMVAAVMLHQNPGQSEQQPFFWQFPEAEHLYGKQVLIVDDIWSDGRFPVAVKTRVRAAGGVPHVAVLHYRPSDSRYPNDRPHFIGETTSDWIQYPWDGEALRS